jgi:prefoldin subunit 5
MASNLEEIHEVYDSVNCNIDILEDPEKVINELQERIMRLEKMNNDLKAKNEDLKKNNIENNSLMNKMSHVGLRRKFTVQTTIKKAEDDSVKLAEIIKEKDDLQEINEKMLDLLTEKEMENEDLTQKLENYKMEAKIENDKNLEKIRNLEDKIELLESEKGGTMYDIDDVVNEYNKSKETLKKQINEYAKNEEDLKAKLDMKDRTIQKLNDDIQQLEIEKFKLINQNTKKDQLKEKDIFEIEKMKTEIDKLTRENHFLEDQLKLEKENLSKIKISHKEEIENIQKQVESEQNNTKNVKEEKIKEINLLKTEMAKSSKNLDIYSKKAEIAEKRLDDEQQKNFMIQNKLDKKTKELQELNEYTKKLLTNKDNLITQYEAKIEEITKDKNDLLTQNKQLLENIKNKNEQNNNTESTTTEEGDNKGGIQHNDVENKLLKEEIKELKEQIDCQAKDLVDLNSFEKEIVKLKSQNESLLKDNKSLKAQLEECKKGRLSIGDKKDLRMFHRQYSMARKESVEERLNEKTFEKKLNVLKKLKDEEKKDFEARIEKINMELAEIKLKNVNLEYECDSLRMKYNNFIKSITSQCKKNGITLNINYS